MNDVGELKTKVNVISQELLVESSKRDDESKTLNDKFTSVENRLDSTNRDIIRDEENLKV